MKYIAKNFNTVRELAAYLNDNDIAENNIIAVFMNGVQYSLLYTGQAAVIETLKESENGEEKS